MEKFLELIAEILEVDPSELSADTDFRKECDFDSLRGFSMICMIEDEYGKTVSVETFLKCRTLGDLFEQTK